ncbi:MAG: gamma-glutamyltransferase [Saprospiraceae bacterium]|nr:gamma-glutamyltransferase [Saprospiraceae bacterium]
MKKCTFAIAAGHQETANAASIVLEDGGNAFDAAVAAYWAACTAEPCMASAGAGGFALVHPVGQKPVLVDFFCQTPMGSPNPAVPFHPLVVDFGDSTETFYIRSGSIAIPGAVAGMFHLQEKYGTRPMSVLAEPGVHLGKRGVPLNKFQAYDLFLLKEFMGDTEKGRSLFYKEGRVKRTGEVIALPQWADYLDDLSRKDARSFYCDEPAKHLIRDHEGHLQVNDLSTYQVIERQPLHVHFLDHDIWTNPAPSMGGMLLGLMLTDMNRWPLEDLADPIRFQPRWDQMCSNLRKNGIRPETLAALLSQWQTSDELPPQAWQGTSHISVVDHAGNAIALTFSIGEGSGYFIPGTDIHMNNMLGEPALLPDGPFTWTQNVRLGSMMAPTVMASKDRESWTAMGSGGAGRIPFMLAQVINRMVAGGLHVPDAVQAPRSHRDDQSLHMEPGFPDRVYHQVYTAPVNPWQKASLFFGGVHAVNWHGDQQEACGDERREGVGIVR